jgi:uncharacterized protein with ParB-like and HNH nuclease domain
MESGILPPELRSIEQLFTGDIRFFVPQYQRSFAWGADEIGELWEDVFSAVDREGDYFLGTIVLQAKGPGIHEIIDGQQRLACISMIFSAIRNCFLANKDDRAEKLFTSFLGAKGFSRDSVPKPKLELNRINNESFVQHVIASNDFETVEKALRAKTLHESNRLLLGAYKYFLGNVISEAGKRGTHSDDFIVPLIDCLRGAVKLITIPVTSDEDANLFFESLNARGKELAVSDLVKNRLYSEAGDENVKRVQDLWEKMENELIRRPIPEYLRHFWIAKKADEKNLNVREKRLYRAIVQDVSGNKKSTVELLRDLAASAHDYVKIGDYSLWPDDEAYDREFEESLKELRLFRVSQCNPLLLNAIQLFSNPKDIAKSFCAVGNFSFRYLIIGNQSSGSLERVFGEIAYGIRTGTYSSPKAVADQLRSINSDATFRGDFSLAAMPKSKARMARYILAKLTNYMSKKAKKSGAEQIVNPDARQVNLEHVLPQSLNPTWRGYFSKGVDPAEYVDRIGNLTLLTTKINSEVADKSFPEKQRLAFEDSSLAINLSFHGMQRWGEAEIDKRQEEMAKTALELWGL